ncbi:hypothetical protein, partial [Photobacterium damselae]|uniref:hypothetical protein n=1 Tax=Photobacterium damselae TaxID=38293 RepID=UPI001C3C5428
IFNLEPLDLQIVALPVNQIILAEPRILRLLGYIVFKIYKTTLPRISFFDISMVTICTLKR